MYDLIIEYFNMMSLWLLTYSLYNSFASFNNADSISGNVYTWNLKEDEPTNIKLQYVQYHPDPVHGGGSPHR